MRGDTWEVIQKSTNSARAGLMMADGGGTARDVAIEMKKTEIFTMFA